MSDPSPEQVIADALHECRDPHASTNAPHVVAALRAAGLLPGPDDIVVSREIAESCLVAAEATYNDAVADHLTAALSQLHPAQEQQT